MTRKEKQKTISQIFNEVSVIAERLESDEVELENLIEAYEKGMGLIRTAQDQLASAELKIKKIALDESLVSEENE